MRFESGLIVNIGTVLIRVCCGTLAPSHFFTVIISFTPTSPNCTVYSNFKSGINAVAIDTRSLTL
jgi:hypothetical protein